MSSHKRVRSFGSSTSEEESATKRQESLSPRQLAELSDQPSVTTRQEPPLTSQNAELSAERSYEAKEDMDARRQEKLVKAMRAIMVMNYAKSDALPAPVIGGLFIGSIGAALNETALLECGVSHVLCVASGIKPP